MAPTSFASFVQSNKNNHDNGTPSPDLDRTFNHLPPATAAFLKAHQHAARTRKRIQRIQETEDDGETLCGDPSDKDVQDNASDTSTLVSFGAPDEHLDSLDTAYLSTMSDTEMNDAPDANTNGNDNANTEMELRDIANVPKPFKNPNWKPSSRRNKTVKQILSEEARKEASQAQSGAVTPANGAAASRPDDLATAVLEKNARAAGPAPVTSAPPVTYMGIEAPPSLMPKKKYCDITGLPANYTDPKTGLRYHDKEVFQVVRSLAQGVPEQYLEARNANTVLK